MKNYLVQLIDAANKNLQKNTVAQNYLLNRKVPLDMALDHGLGYVKKIRQIGLGTAEARKFNAWLKHAPQNALVFPIYNLAGEPAGIQLRSIEGKAYDKFFLKDSSFPGIFFGSRESLRSCYEKKWGFIVEGAFDYFSIRTLLPNTLALLTVNMSSGQKRLIRRFMSGVVLGLDSDGKEETLRSINSAQRGLRKMGVTVRVASSLAKDWNDDHVEDERAFKENCQNIISTMTEIMIL